MGRATTPQREAWTRLWAPAAIGLLLAAVAVRLAAAAGEAASGPGPRAGLASTSASCLAVPAGGAGRATANVRLEWAGQADEALVALAPAGASHGGALYLNGVYVGRVPAAPGGAPCRPGAEEPGQARRAYLRVPVSLLAAGQNQITLQSDARDPDGWTAADVHLVIYGAISGPPVAALAGTPAVIPGAEATAAVGAAQIQTVFLTSTYELAQGQLISQAVYYQVPASYLPGVPAPLVIGVHGLDGTGLGFLTNVLSAEANLRGWLAAAPDMHNQVVKNEGKKALGWIGAQHDILDTVAWMMANYTVDPQRIYIVGGSMGGQITAIMAAKHPDVFAAAYPWKPIASLSDWHAQLTVFDPYNDLAGILPELNNQTPAQNPFEYERRSALQMPQNVRLIPQRLWHNQADQLVPITHSLNLSDAVNAWNPVTPLALVIVNDNSRPDVYNHIQNPAMADVFDFLAPYQRVQTAPASLALRTDEAKSYYWLDIQPAAGSPRWTQVQAAYYPVSATVTAVTSDSLPLVVGFNVGAAPAAGPAGLGQAGLGLTAARYWVSVDGGAPYQQDYVTGYLTVTLPAGQAGVVVAADRPVFLPAIARGP